MVDPTRSDECLCVSSKCIGEHPSLEHPPLASLRLLAPPSLRERGGMSR